MRRATRCAAQHRQHDGDFYPRSPCGERRLDTTTERELLAISIHALLAESDENQKGNTKCLRSFLSTLSLRRATSRGVAVLQHGVFLSTLSLRRATALMAAYGNALDISIHALLAESDEFGYASPRAADISIHALLAESDGIHINRIKHNMLFLSTLSLRRATHSGQMPSWPNFDFYPRSPCGERPRRKKALHKKAMISIHALLAESDRFYRS